MKKVPTQTFGPRAHRIAFIYCLPYKPRSGPTAARGVVVRKAIFPSQSFGEKKRRKNAKTDKINNVVGSGPTRISLPIDAELRFVTETLLPPDDR